MKLFTLILSCLFVFNISYGQTVTELLDEAQKSIKEAFEANSNIKAPYEYYKAETFYNIAKEQTSKLHLDAGKAAALKSIEWSLRAISKSYAGGEK
ncbi:hypothetical protein [Hydrogenothermus marinus]|uniref:Small metal-binding protein n=1 Tax=Hydrogenothermus marinus TaxID=133270 RepID=A0A3M0BJC4_9AQUI|nr:hypothetical protein [Hydrogenothermus marinus]RMA97311.1 hypothetical protein CLV39_0969 [Hydrogenothermus marinus]